MTNKIKFLLLFSLIICGGLFFFSVDDAKAIVGCGTPYGSDYTGLNYSTTMTAGTSTTIGVGFTNCGTNTWTVGGNYKLGTIDPQDNTTWGLNRVSVGSAVVPGANKVFSFQITAPATPGTYVLRFQMVRDGVAWFGDGTPYVTVTVAAPGTSPSCTSAGPQGAVEAYGSTWHTAYAYGVANTTSAAFAAKTSVSDWVWWPGTNLGGGTWSGGIATDTAYTGTVLVNVYLNNASYTNVLCGSANYTKASPAAPSVSISAADPNISYGGSTGIYWSSSGIISSCSVSPIGSTAQGMPYPGHPVGPLYVDTTYTISCSGPGGTGTDSVTVSLSLPVSPTCSSVSPDGTWVKSNETKTFSANGVDNATTVVFPTWSAVSGQDDIVWYPGTNAGGGTWSVSVNVANHPGYGLVYAASYMSNASFSNILCGTASVNKVKTGSVSVIIEGSNGWTITGPEDFSQSGAGNINLSDLFYGNYTITPSAVSGYTIYINGESTTSKTIELKD